MQQTNLTDKAAAREWILNNIRKAVTGRPVPDTERPGGSFVHSCEAALTNTFIASLEKLSGKSWFYNSKHETLKGLARLVEEKGWKNISCPESTIAEFLQSSHTPFSFNQLTSLECDVVITGCEALIADTGSILVSSAHTGSRQAFVNGPAHVVVASEMQVTETSDMAMKTMLKRFNGIMPSLISIITGPSRTADIEKTLILGVHGPKELYVFISGENI